MPMKLLKIYLISMLIVALTQCTPLGPQYRNIQQGNILDDDDVDQLSLGMGKEQVTDILGTPVINDTFEPDRWEYVYTHEVSGEVLEKHHIIIEFQNNRVIDIEQNLEGE